MMLASVAYAEPEAFHPFAYHHFPYYATPYQVKPQQATPYQVKPQVYQTISYNPYMNHASEPRGSLNHASMAHIEVLDVFLPVHEDATTAVPYEAGDVVYSCDTSGISQGGIDMIVDIHNDERRKAAAKFGKRYRSISWSEDMARAAKAFIDRCDTDMQHQKGNDEGENLATSFTTEVLSDYPNISKFERLVRSWMDEQNLGFYNDPMTEGSNDIGHYTQAIWSNTNKVGCAIALLDVKKRRRANSGNYATFRSEYRLYCFYTPQGNWVGQRPVQ